MMEDERRERVTAVWKYKVKEGERGPCRRHAFFLVCLEALHLEICLCSQDCALKITFYEHPFRPLWRCKSAKLPICEAFIEQA